MTVSKEERPVPHRTCCENRNLPENVAVFVAQPPEKLKFGKAGTLANQGVLNKAPQSGMFASSTLGHSLEVFNIPNRVDSSAGRLVRNPEPRLSQQGEQTLRLADATFSQDRLIRCRFLHVLHSLQ
jgi:hypothetical protein